MSRTDDAVQRWTIAVGDARRELFGSRPNLSAIDLADGEAFLAALIEGSLRFVHHDAARPTFEPWTTLERRWMDNGRDSVYAIAPLDGAHRYRIHGVRGDECYLSFTVYGGTPGHPETLSLNVNHRDLGAEPGESYSIEVSPPADACYVISRQYFLDPLNERGATMHIDVLDGPAPAVPTDETLAARWDAATGFLHAMTAPRTATGPTPRFVSRVDNEMGDPSVWSGDQGAGRGTPDQTYAMGPYALRDGEALVIDVQFPPCTYASAALWNRFSQSVDARFHTSTINHQQAVTNADGWSRVVISATDPGVANWLDTGGRTHGSVYWRFLLADHAPPPLVSRVVPVADVRTLP